MRISDWSSDVCSSDLLAGTDRLQTDREPRCIHHHEHARQTTMGLADQPAQGTIEIERTRCTAPHAHLVFKRDDFDTVDLRPQTVALAAPRPLSWHEEHRQAPTAGRPIGPPGRHQEKE